MNRQLETWTRDLTQGVRSLLRAPAFTFVTVVTLALAIGSTTAIFSVVDAVLLNDLPVPDEDRLVAIRGTAPGTQLPDEFGVPDELYVHYRSETNTLSDLGAVGVFQATSRVDGQVERLFGAQATPSFFSTLGTNPILGRLPVDDEESPVVVLSHWLWTSWFAADSAVIGRSYELANGTRTVIGVMPPDFRFPDERVSMWVAWDIDPNRVRPGGLNGPPVVARLAPGVSYTEVETELRALGLQVAERFGGSPQYARIMEQHRPVVRSLREEMIGNIGQPLWVLLGAVGIVFLIACVNVANLFTVRSESRHRDLAVRRALGAGRGSLIRSQMAEAMVLATCGGAIGILIAWPGVPLLVRAAPDAVASGWSSAPIPGLESASLNITALVFALIASLVAAAACGLWPAIRSSAAAGLAGLGQAGRGVVGRGLSRDVLVVAQTAMALVLLTGSALLVRSFWQLSRVDPGYDTQGIFSFQIAPDRPEINNYESSALFHYAFIERLEALPGVQSVGVVATLPLDEGAGNATITTPQHEATGLDAPRVRVTGANSSYFVSMGIDILSGRVFDRSEDLAGPAVNHVVVSQSAAQLLWPGEDPLGQQLKPVGGESWQTVIGVVDDVLLDNFRRVAPEPLVYVPRVSGSPAYVVRSDRAGALAPEVRALIREMVPESPMYRVFTMQELAARTMGSLTFTMLMVGLAAFLALVLGSVGLYGVLSYRVTCRRKEIGVRMAVGAQEGMVRRMVVMQGGRVVLVGVMIGLAASLGLTRYIETLLFGVERLDGLTFVAMAGLMGGVALLASYLPARRASQLDPVEALRAE